MTLTRGTGMRWQPAALGVAAVLVLPACGGTAPRAAADLAVRTTPAHHHTGTVQGRYELEGGPIQPGGSPPPVRPLAGTVTFRGPGARISARAGTTGRFSVRLPAGSYAVSGRSPSIREQLPDGHVVEGGCSAPQTVRVRAGQTERITVRCLAP